MYNSNKLYGAREHGFCYAVELMLQELLSVLSVYERRLKKLRAFEGQIIRCCLLIVVNTCAFSCQIVRNGGGKLGVGNPMVRIGFYGFKPPY